MSSLSEQEKRQIIESPPKGTLTIIVIYGIVFGVLWLALYFGRFMAHGPVS